MRRFFHDLRDEIAAHFSATMSDQDEEKIEKKITKHYHKAAAGFLFLRLFSPAIISPHEYGIYKEKPERELQRFLILISKVLQNLSNGVYFRESYMENMNNFISKNLPTIRQYFDDLPVPNLLLFLFCPSLIYVKLFLGRNGFAYITTQQVGIAERDGISLGCAVHIRYGEYQLHLRDPLLLRFRHRSRCSPRIAAEHDHRGPSLLQTEQEILQSSTREDSAEPPLLCGRHCGRCGQGAGNHPTQP